MGRLIRGDTAWFEPTTALLELIQMPPTESQLISRLPSSRTNGPHIHLHASRTPDRCEFTAIGSGGWMSGAARPKRSVERFLEMVAAVDSG